MPKVKGIAEWDIETPIQWQRDARKKLNKIIRRFNKWQTKHQFNREKGTILLAYIQVGLDTIGGIGGGWGYKEALQEMQEHVENVMEDEND